MDQEVPTEVLAGSWQMQQLLYMRWADAMCTLCTHQMAALFHMK